MALSTTHFDPLSPFSPKSPNFALQNIFFVETRSRHHKYTLCSNVFAQFAWVRGVAYQKQLSGPKLMGVWARGACKTLGSLFVSATTEANNFKFGKQLGLAEQLAEKQLLR